MYYLTLTWLISVTFTWANCPDVSGLQANTLSDTEAILSWDEMPGASHYQLKVELEEGTAPFAFWLSLDMNSYTLDGLDPNGVYKFKVRTLCGDEKASWSEYYFFNTLENGNGVGLCDPPAQLLASLDANGTATLNWEAVPGALLYEVEVESEEDTPFFVQEFFTSDNFIEINGLVPNGIYKFKVKSKCGGSNSSSYSAWFVFPQGSGNGGGGNPGTCDIPTGLTAFDISTTSVSITWDPVLQAEGYEIEVEDDENTPAFEWEAIVTDNFVEISGLVAGGNYQVKVKTQCIGDQNSEYTEWVFFSTNNFNGNGPQSLAVPTASQVGLQNSALSLSPNPAVCGEMIQVQIEKGNDADGMVWIMVYDLQGHLYHSMEVPAQNLESLQIPTLGLRPGIYQVLIRSNENIQSRRFSLLD